MPAPSMPLEVFDDSIGVWVPVELQHDHEGALCVIQHVGRTDPAPDKALLDLHTRGEGDVAGKMFRHTSLKEISFVDPFERGDQFSFEIVVNLTDHYAAVPPDGTAPQEEDEPSVMDLSLTSLNTARPKTLRFRTGSYQQLEHYVDPLDEIIALNGLRNVVHERRASRRSAKRLSTTAVYIPQDGGEQ